MTDIRTALAQSVLSHRTRLGLSQAKLAQRAGVSTALVKNIERLRADPYVVFVLQLANALGVALTELIDGETRPDARASRQYPDPQRLAAAIAPRIRALRRERGWSRSRFCEISGISRGMLHYLETGSVQPGTTMIERVARAFGLSFVDFVEMIESPVIAIARAAEPRTETERLQRIVDERRSSARVDVSTSHVAPRGRIVAEPAPNDSTSVVYVIEGSIRLTFDIEHHVLSAGDAVLFSAASPHTFMNTAATTAAFLEVRLVPRR